jgi:hypothetical protein
MATKAESKRGAAVKFRVTVAVSVRVLPAPWMR